MTGSGNAGCDAPALVLQLLPQGEGGVRDFADALAGAWQPAGTASPRLSLTQASTEAQALHLQLDALCGNAAPSRAEARQALLPVVVHYSGYGYHPRGLCAWLPQELAELRRRRLLRLTVIFHEIQASGPPWQSAFWLGGLQARVARQVVQQADVLWTNTEQHATRLRRMQDHSRGTPLVVRPVFSNVGEPESPAPLAGRTREMVVFGSQASRQRAAQALRRNSSILSRLGVTELVEAGLGTAAMPHIPGVPTRFTGALDKHQLGALLLRCRFGLIDYPSQLLAKSSVFAAYAAHGCVVVNLRREAWTEPVVPADGLSAGKHCIAAGVAPGTQARRTAQPLLDDAFQDMADAAFAWYAGHALPGQAAAELLRLASSGADPSTVLI